MEPQTLPSIRSSSSIFPRQRWSQRSQSTTSQVPPTTTSQHNSATGYRTPALRQRTTPPRPQSQSQANPSEQRPSIPTAPVLVRAYSGEQNKPTQQLQPPMSSARRFFPFSTPRPSTSRPSPSEQIILPSEKDFSIESILQAIDPDIRSTLDSIAEICGRSKLSLANEYSSHIAPLGEICATPSSLDPVEEVVQPAHSPGERRVDDSIAVTEEGNSNMDSNMNMNMNLPDVGLDMHPFSFHRYLETLRHTASIMEDGDGAEHEHSHSSQREMDMEIRRPRSPGMNSQAETVLAIREIAPLAREIVARPRPKGSGRDLLGGIGSGSGSGGEGGSVNMATPAVVSEVYLAASADDLVSGDSGGLAPTAVDGHGTPGIGVGYSSSEIIHSLLGWLKWRSGIVGTGSSPALLSAEGRLRAMLDRVEGRGVHSAREEEIRR
ncbi:hypothetical protein N7461_001777 [Penicillium sp. DV-2018c]|nr:hypothetical protein N7461_001777 [Penicillium sp. DV-2018c]